MAVEEPPAEGKLPKQGTGKCPALSTAGIFRPSTVHSGPGSEGRPQPAQRPQQPMHRHRREGERSARAVGDQTWVPDNPVQSLRDSSTQASTQITCWNRSFRELPNKPLGTGTESKARDLQTFHRREHVQMSTEEMKEATETRSQTAVDSGIVRGEAFAITFKESVRNQPGKKSRKLSDFSYETGTQNPRRRLALTNHRPLTS